MHAEPGSWLECSQLADLVLFHLGTYQKHFMHGPTHPRLPPVNGQDCVIPKTVPLSPRFLLARKFPIQELQL